MKKQLFGRGLVAAMESEEILAEGAEEQQPLVVPEADTMAADMMEVSDAAEEVEAVDSAIEEAVEGAEQLEEIAQIAEGSLDNGGMDETSAQLMETAVESIYNRLGVVTSAKMSLESFGTKGTRVQSTKLAIEGIKETTKAIWDKIIAAIKSMWNSISTWFAKLFDAATKMSERAKKIKAGVAAAKDKTAKEAEVSGSFVKKLTLQGKTNGSGVVTGLTEMKNLQVLNLQAVRAMTKQLETVKTAEEVKATATASPELQKVFSEKVDETTSKTPRLLGDIAITLSGTRVSVDEYDKKAVSKNETAETASLDVIDNIAKEASFLGTQVTASKEAIAQAQKAINTFTKVLDAIAKSATEEAAAGFKEAQAAAPKASAMLAAVSTKFNGTAVSVGGAALDYAEKSLAQYA